MKRKLEDRLVRLAFEDVSLEESAALEKQASLDPESAEALNQYRQLRLDLRGLADVPPHQLSNERLREAILAQGLKPRATDSILSWLWMPASTMCLVAIAFVVYQRHQPVEPQIIGAPVVAGAKSGVPPLKWDPNRSALAIARLNRQKRVPSLGPSRLQLIAATSSHRLARRHRRRTENPEGSLYADRLGPTGSFPEEPGQGPDAANTSSLQANPTANLVPVDANPSSPVVLIDTETDASTGASRATEVGSGKNVVVGG